ADRRGTQGRGVGRSGGHRPGAFHEIHRDRAAVASHLALSRPGDERRRAPGHPVRAAALFGGDQLAGRPAWSIHLVLPGSAASVWMRSMPATTRVGPPTTRVPIMPPTLAPVTRPGRQAGRVMTQPIAAPAARPTKPPMAVARPNCEAKVSIARLFSSSEATGVTGTGLALV